MSKSVIYQVTSDNYDKAYLTAEAYKALTLEMSTGDHATHKAVKVSKVPKDAEVLTLWDVSPDAAFEDALKALPKAVAQWARENTFSKRNSRGGLDSYANYSGPDFGHMICSLGQGRDSDVLTQSNFASALEQLGGESDTVEVHRFGHWACGWFEGIMIDPRDAKAVTTAYEIHKALENYPVLDDSDYSEREREAVESDFENYQYEFEKTVLNVLGLDRDDLQSELSAADFEAFERDLEALTRVIHEADVSYRGHEDAFVSEDAVIRCLTDRSHDYEITALDSDLADYALLCVGRERNPNYVGRWDGDKFIQPNGPLVLEVSGGSNE